MEETSPEAFRARFHEAKRRRRIAIWVITTMFILIGWGIIRIFLDDFTHDTVRWTVIVLTPIAWFGWVTGRRIGDEFEYDVWKEFRLSQMLAVGDRRSSLDDLMAEVLGGEETYRRRQEAERASDAADNAPSGPSGAGSGPASAPSVDPAPEPPANPPPPGPNA